MMLTPYANMYILYLFVYFVHTVCVIITSKLKVKDETHVLSHNCSNYMYNRYQVVSDTTLVIIQSVNLYKLCCGESCMRIYDDVE